MPETKSLGAPDEICQTLAKQESEFGRTLPSQITPDRFIRVAQTAVRNNPDLATLDRMSLYGAFHKCAADGLLPDGREAAIVGFGGKAVYMPMVYGICKKARNSGEIKEINSMVVYKNDEYDRWIDEAGEHFKHRPARGERGDPILTYAFVRTKDGTLFFEEIDMIQMKEIESKSKGGWKSFRTEFMRKSAIRRLLKYRVPSSTDLDSVVRAEDEDFNQDPPERKPVAGTSSRLRDVINTEVVPNVEIAPVATDVQQSDPADNYAQDTNAEDLPI